MPRCLLPLLLLPVLLLPSAAFAETTYTCPAQYSARDEGARTVANTNLSQKTIVVSMDLFTTAADGWSAEADMSTLFSCEVLGFVVDQGSRVLLTCTCAAPKVNGVSPIQTSTTLIVAAGSQCSYSGNLQFTCE